MDRWHEVDYCQSCFMASSAENPKTTTKTKQNSEMPFTIVVKWCKRTVYKKRVFYRVGSLAFPTIWVEAFLLLSQCFSLHGVHPSLLILHFFPLITQNHTNSSGGKREIIFLIISASKSGKYGRNIKTNNITCSVIFTVIILQYMQICDCKSNNVCRKYVTVW